MLASVPSRFSTGYDAARTNPPLKPAIKDSLDSAVAQTVDQGWIRTVDIEAPPAVELAQPEQASPPESRISVGFSLGQMITHSDSSYSLELGANNQILMQQNDSAGITEPNPAIDGFLTSFLPGASQSSQTTPTLVSERLITDDQVFSSLVPGTRHQVSRKSAPKEYPDRGEVPENWEPDYKPTFHLSPVVAAGPEWAETPDFAEAKAKRALSAGLSPSDPRAGDIRALFPSYEESQVVDGKPRNPRGPTGISGQGLLGKHGANSAADPVVFRRQRDPETGQSKLQMIAIQRRDNGNWAIPGGMTDFGESVSETLGRELREEALGDKATPEQAKKFDNNFKILFDEKGTQVYQGAVDDFRNTDTSWMETSVKMVELTENDAQKLGWDMTLTAGDDAQDAQWMDISEANLKRLNANHGDFVGKSVQIWQQQTGLVVRKDGVVADA